jgi:hypothetical protein
MRTLVLVAFVAVATVQATVFAQNDRENGPAPSTRELPAVVFDLDALGGPATRLAGREVALRDIQVDEIETRGFWATTPGRDSRVFVLPAEGDLVPVDARDLVNIHGDVRPLTPEFARRLDIESAASVFIYAYTVRPAVVAPR